MSLLLRSGLGWSLKRSPRNSASERPRFWSMTPIEPSKITIRCLNSRSRRSWTEVATAMVTLKTTESAFSQAPAGLQTWNRPSSNRIRLPLLASWSMATRR